jgi:hypothetical protein
MPRKRKQSVPLPKIILPLQDNAEPIVLTMEEYDLLNDIIQYMCCKADNFIEFANEFRRNMYGNDWEPSDELTEEKYEKAFDGIVEKWGEAGMGCVGDLNRAN